MSPKSSRKKENTLNEIHFLLADLAISFRREVVKELQISIPTYYRRLKIERKVNKAKIIRLALKELKLVTQKIQKKRTTPKLY